MRCRATKARWFWVSRKSFNNMLFAAKWWQDRAASPEQPPQAEIRKFTLDMAQLICPQCEADAFPADMGEAIDWALSHQCGAS